MWPFIRRGPSGFSSSSTAEEVTQGIDGAGLTAIVTGASSGIGTETARILALRGVHVIMGVRNMSAGQNAKEVIIKDTPTAKVDVLELDLSSMASVRKFASQFDSLNLPLNILINNAGIMATPFLRSQDGIELQFATNHIGHFLLTHLLLKNMKNSAKRCNIEGRIVNVSSEAHRMAYSEGICFDRINDKSKYQSYFAYGQSKLANILHTVELSRQFKEEGANVTANSLHPGLVVTNLFRNHGLANAIMSTAGKLLMKNVQQGAATTCYVALHPQVRKNFACGYPAAPSSVGYPNHAGTNLNAPAVKFFPQVRGMTGKYFSNSNVAKPSSKASDTDLAKKLWDFSMKIIST